MCQSAMHGEIYFSNRAFIHLQKIIRYTRLYQHLKASFKHLWSHDNSDFSSDFLRGIRTLLCEVHTFPEVDGTRHLENTISSSSTFHRMVLEGLSRTQHPV